MKVYRGEVALGHPQFAPDSAAACKRHDGPITDDSKIIYTEADNKLIEDWIRGSVISAWHSMSTCPMGNKGEGGVVDPKLNVYGVAGLKVAGQFSHLDDWNICADKVDVSVVPKHMGTNMASVALTIGEKAADIIQNELSYGS
jgi:alcohol oxidase